MIIQRTDKTVKLWLSAKDTYDWAHKEGSNWPCSQLSGKSLFAEFYDGDLTDHLIDGNSFVQVDANEFTAITSDFIGS